MSKHFTQVSRLVSENVKFTWKIEYFTWIKSDSGYSIESDAFQCLGTEWKLKLLPNGTTGDTEFVIVEIIKPPDRNSYHDCKFCIGFENKFGSPFSKEYYYKTLISRETLMSEKDIFLPDDVLTVFCDLKVYKFLTGSLTERIEPSQLEGSLKLSDDLQSAIEEAPLSDIVLKFEDGEFHGHKIILSCRSKVFQWKFKQMKEEEDSMQLGMKKVAGMDMIQYIYTGKLPTLPLPRIFELFDNAEAYDIHELKQRCRDQLIEILSAENICDIALFANSHNEKAIVAASVLTLKKNLESVLRSERWKSFAENNPALYTSLLERTLLEN